VKRNKGATSRVSTVHVKTEGKRKGKLDKREREREKGGGGREKERKRKRSYRSEPRGLEIGFLAASRNHRRAKRRITLVVLLLNCTHLANV